MQAGLGDEAGQNELTHRIHQKGNNAVGLGAIGAAASANPLFLLIFKFVAAVISPKRGSNSRVQRKNL